MRTYCPGLAGPRAGGTNIMAGRSWFFATDGQQHGPYSEDQFHDLIGRGDIRPDTYVWSEGMAAWQFAGEVPGLLSSGPPPVSPPVSQTAVRPVVTGGDGAAAVSLEVGAWALLWRSFV